jgi:hypothetical protein
MKKPEARELIDPLIDWADVVVENFSPGTMKKLGLDYDALAARNPASSWYRAAYSARPARWRRNGAWTAPAARFPGAPS